jgi:hypothetical protein
MSRPKRVYKPLPEGLTLGADVRYYQNGWRTGRLDAWEKGVAVVMPYGKTNHIKVVEVNIEPIEDIRGSGIGGARR